MTLRARFYITSVIVAAAAIVALSAGDMQRPAELHVGIYGLMTLIAAGIKVRVPGFTATMSLSFLFLLAAVTEFRTFESVLMAACAGIVQCLWRPAARPKLIQVVFSAAALVVTVAASSLSVRGVRELATVTAPPILIMIAAFVYYGCNSLLVTTAMYLSSDKRFARVWQQCNAWAYPFYLFGAVMLSVTASDPRLGWRGPLVVLPLMVLAAICYRSMTVGTDTVSHRMRTATD